MTHSDISRFVVSLVGALALSATCIAAAVAPVQAAPMQTPSR